jgi:hypothetical protein
MILVGVEGKVLQLMVILWLSWDLRWNLSDKNGVYWNIGLCPLISQEFATENRHS